MGDQHGDRAPVPGPAGGPGDGLEQGVLGLGVEVGGRLVEEEQQRVAHAGPGQRQALPLPARQFDAVEAPPELGVEAGGQRSRTAPAPARSAAMRIW